jgi:hypothetical protein
MEELRELEVQKPELLVEGGFLPRPGAVILVAPHKCGKTVLSAQLAFAIASDHCFLENYRILAPGPVIVIEQDDPSGAASWQGYLKASPYLVKDRLILFTKHPMFVLGEDFAKWLEEQILNTKARLVVLDTLTALRPHRRPGGDLVKQEHEELNALDELAKRTDCTILVLHHNSKGSFGMDWSDLSAGTYAVGAAVEGQIHMSRFPDLGDMSLLRLVRVRSRHGTDLAIVIKFREKNLDYEFVLEGGAAPDYPLLLQIQSAFGDRTFGPKDLCEATGMSRQTATRYIERLYRADALVKPSFGVYKCRESVAAAKG